MKIPQISLCLACIYYRHDAGPLQCSRFSKGNCCRSGKIILAKLKRDSFTICDAGTWPKDWKSFWIFLLRLFSVSGYQAERLPSSGHCCIIALSLLSCCFINCFLIACSLLSCCFLFAVLLLFYIAFCLLFESDEKAANLNNSDCFLIAFLHASATGIPSAAIRKQFVAMKKQKQIYCFLIAFILLFYCCITASRGFFWLLSCCSFIAVLLLRFRKGSLFHIVNV